MATLLHLDSAVFPQGSASREVTAAFRPDVARAAPRRHRSSTATSPPSPLPHLDAAAAARRCSRRPAAQRARRGTRPPAADAVLIGAPMYNFTIPSTLKAWLDQVIIVGHNAGPDSPVAGTPVTVVASRGGSYAPGTPREDSEFVRTTWRSC